MAVLFCVLIAVTALGYFDFDRDPLLVDILKQGLLDVFAFVCFAAWYRTRRTPPLVFPLKAPILAFLTTGAISAVFSAYFPVSLQSLSNHIALVLLFLLAANTLMGKERLLCACTASLACLASVYSLLQHSGIDPLRMSQGYPSSTFVNQNELGAFLAVSLPCCLYFIRSAPLRRWYRVAGAAIPTLIVVTGTALTGTRSAWMASAIALAVFCLRGVRRKTIAAAAVLLIVIGCGPSGLAVTWKSRIKPALVFPSSSATHRLLMWETAFDMAAGSPVTGLGTGTFAMYYPGYQGRHLSEERFLQYKVSTVYAHNDFLERAAETGFTGLLAYFFLIAALLRSAWKRRASHSGAAVFSMTAAFTALSFSSYPLSMPAVTAVFFTFCGMMYSGEGRDGPQRPAKASRTRALILWPAIFATVVFVLLPPLAGVLSCAAEKQSIAARPAAALRLYRLCAGVWPVNADTQYNMGIVYEASGDTGAALRSYLHALDLQPFHAKAHLRAARVYGRSGLFKQAMYHYLKAEEIYPNSAVIHTEAGKLLASRGFHAAARAHFSQALRVQPGNSQLRLIKGLGGSARQ